MEHEGSVQLSQEMMEGIALSLEGVKENEDAPSIQTDIVFENASETTIEESGGFENPNGGQDELEQDGDSSLLMSLKEENQKLGEKIDGLEFLLKQQNENYKKVLNQIDATVDQLDRVNKNLHKENQELKEGLYDSMRKPVLKDIIEMCIDLMSEINLEKKRDRTEAVEILEEVLERLHSILDIHGVEVYEPKVGDEYEPLVQKIVGTMEASGDNKRQISEVKSVGYRYVNNNDEQIVLTKDEDSNTIFVPARVVVYK